LQTEHKKEGSFKRGKKNYWSCTSVLGAEQNGWILRGGESVSRRWSFGHHRDWRKSSTNSSMESKGEEFWTERSRGRVIF